MTTPRARAKRCRRLLSATLLSLLVVGCGPTSGGGSDDGGGTSTTSDGGSSGSETSTTHKDRNVIAWILGLGAGSPPGPAEAEYAAYQALLNQHCDKALGLATSSGKVFSAIEAAAKACQAARAGDEQLWSAVTDDRDDLLDADLDCLQAGAFELLERLVGAHQSEPDLPFTFDKGQGKGAPPCPSVSGVSPAHGVAGDVVVVKGKHLDFVKQVIIDFGDAGPAQCFESSDDPAPHVQVPEPPAGATSATIIVTADPAQWPMGRAKFTYDQTGESTSSTSTLPSAEQETSAGTGPETAQRAVIAGVADC